MPVYFYFPLLFQLTFISCAHDARRVAKDRAVAIIPGNTNEIRGISLPPGFSFVNGPDQLYTNWLLDMKFKKDNRVRLFDGTIKSTQENHYRVLDIPVGNKNLLQCADAAIKLKSDYLFENGRYSEISYIPTNGDELSFQQWLYGFRWKEKDGRLISYATANTQTDIRTGYMAFMNIVYSYCGTYSLSRQLKPVTDVNSIQPGDIFIEGGFPGHAVTVMAVAKNYEGCKIFLLSQGYLPAQDIHILKNPCNANLGPWYTVSDLYPLRTPQWTFEKKSLKRW